MTDPCRFCPNKIFFDKSKTPTLKSLRLDVALVLSGPAYLLWLLEGWGLGAVTLETILAAYKQNCQKPLVLNSTLIFDCNYMCLDQKHLDRYRALHRLLN